METHRISMTMAIVLGMASLNLSAGPLDKANPNVAETPAAGSGTSIPKQPAFGKNPALKNADMAREAKEMNEIGRVHQAQQTHLDFTDSASRRHDPARGTALEGRGIDSGGSDQDVNHGNENNAAGASGSDVQNCLANPAGCLAGQAGGSSRPAMVDRMRAPSPLAHPDHGIVEKNKDSTEDNKNDKRGGESGSEGAERSEGPEGPDTAREANQEMREAAQDYAHAHQGGGNGFPAFDSDGGFTAGSGKPQNKPKPLQHDQASQPLPVDSATGPGNDPCRPDGGDCRKPYKPTPKEMTGQPGPGQEETASSGGNAPSVQLRNEAVTNPGEGGWTGGPTGQGGGGSHFDPSQRYGA